MTAHPSPAELAAMLRALGRGNDTMLAHITPREAAMLKREGGSGTINPHTGLPEFDDGGGGGAPAGGAPATPSYSQYSKFLPADVISALDTGSSVGKPSYMSDYAWAALSPQAQSDYSGTVTGYTAPTINPDYASGLDLGTGLGLDTLAARTSSNNANALPIDPAVLAEINKFSTDNPYAGSGLPNSFYVGGAGPVGESGPAAVQTWDSPYFANTNGYATLTPEGQAALNSSQRWAVQNEKKPGFLDQIFSNPWTGLLASFGLPIAIGTGAGALGFAPAFGVGTAAEGLSGAAAGGLGAATAGSAADLSVSDLGGITAGAGDIGGVSGTGALIDPALSDLGGITAGAGDIGGTAGAALDPALSDLGGITAGAGGIGGAAGDPATLAGVMSGLDAQALDPVAGLGMAGDLIPGVPAGEAVTGPANIFSAAADPLPTAGLGAGGEEPFIGASWVDGEGAGIGGGAAADGGALGLDPSMSDLGGLVGGEGIGGTGGAITTSEAGGGMFGSGSFLDKIGLGSLNGAWGTLKDISSGLRSISPLISAAGIAANLLKPSPKALGSGALQANASNLQNTASDLQKQGQNLLGGLTTGQIPPGAEAGIDLASQAAKAQIRGNFANMGLSGSSMEAQALGQVDTQAASQRYNTAVKLAQIGLSMVGGATGIDQQLLQQQIAQDSSLQTAIGEFESALAGTGSRALQLNLAPGQGLA